MGGFSSLCGSDQSFGFDAPPGGTALRRDKRITGRHRRRSDSSPGGREVRDSHTRVRKSQTAASAGSSEWIIVHLWWEARDRFNIWKYTRALFHSGSTEWGFHITFFTITVSFGKERAVPNLETKGLYLSSSLSFSFSLSWTMEAFTKRGELAWKGGRGGTWRLTKEKWTKKCCVTVYMEDTQSHMRSCDNSTPPTSDPHCLLLDWSMPEQADIYTSIICMWAWCMYITGAYLPYLTCKYWIAE